MVSPAPCLRDNVVHLEYLEREVHPTTSAPALLLPKQNMLILPVVDGCIYVSSPGMSVRAVTRRLWKRSPIDPCNRTLTSSTALAERSMPNHSRPSFSAATQAVAQPQNGSKTTSPGLLLARIILSSKAMGFWVGNPVCSWDCAPSNSSFSVQRFPGDTSR